MRYENYLAFGLMIGLASFSLVGTGCGGGEFSGAVAGNVQKGPFTSGTEITINELTEELDQTGRSFSTTIADDSGAFRVSSVELASGFARVRANGFYFDETSGEISESPLSLVTLVNFEASPGERANVNVFGHLQSPRIEYLMQEEGLEFEDARAQAHEEVLAIFGFETDGEVRAELLDIGEAGADNAMLLAASVILQNTRSVGELSELLAAIQTDLRTNGELNSTTSGAALMNGAVTANPEQIRAGLHARYDSLGLAAVVPEFEPYLEAFVENAPYEFTGGIEYPEGTTRLNLLHPDFDSAGYGSGEEDGGDFEVRALLPLNTELTVQISFSNSMSLGVVQGSSQGWDVSFPESPGSPWTFESLSTGEVSVDVSLTGPGTATVEYFEYGSDVPTRTRTFTN